MREIKKESRKINKQYNDSSNHNFRVLKQKNKDFLSDISIPKHIYPYSKNTIKKNQESLSKKLKSLISKVNNIINEDHLYDNNNINEHDNEDEDIKSFENSNDSNSYENLDDENSLYDSFKTIPKTFEKNSTIDNSIHNSFKKIMNSKKKMHTKLFKNKNLCLSDEKEKILNRFNKDLLNLSSIMEKKKKQLSQKENEIKGQEDKMQNVLFEFDRIINDNRTWEENLEIFRRDYQSSIDILNRQNKRLLESVEELSKTEEELRLQIKLKDIEIKNLKTQNEKISIEKNKAQNISNEMKKEIDKLKEKIRTMQNTNTELNESIGKLSQEKTEDIKKNVSISVKPNYQSIEVQTEESNMLEKIINQQYLDIKKLFNLFHYVLTLYNKNNMDDDKYRILWNDIRTKFYKNQELKPINIFNFVTYILNFSLTSENLDNIFEAQSDHFVYLYLEFILDYVNQNSLSIEQVNRKYIYI
ncbi:hypothetical protein U3516DRAFT_256237 [Neocallimastix sp. 'constans']